MSLSKTQLVAIMALLGLVAHHCQAEGENMHNMDVEVKAPSSFEIPFKGPGQLATIWSWGPIQGERALVLTSHGESRRINVEAPDRVRWCSPTELLVEQSVRPVRNGLGTRILRRRGEVMEVLSDRDEGLGSAEPSPDGEQVLLERYDRRGFRGIEVRSLAKDFRLEVFHPASVKLGSGDFGSSVWSPDGSQFAVGLWVTNPPIDPTRMSPRLAIASRDTPGFTRVNDVLPSGMPDPETERWAVIPLFWNEDGIYAGSNRGLLRCDPKGSGCALAYSPGKDRSIVNGTPVGTKKALLLVQDLKLDFLEIRAKEIHEVDLTTGKGHLLLRLPENVFINDIDWIEGVDSKSK